MRPELLVTGDVAAVAGQAVLDGIARAVAERGRARLGLAGGSSPGPVLRWLAPRVDPDTVVVTWVDERHLGGPTDDWRELPAESNARGTWEAWFQHVDRVPEHVSMVRPGTLEEARAAYEADFEARMGGVDVLLLGAGPDGHVASLFPGHAVLDATGTCASVDDSPKPPPERLTLTLPVLQAAATTVLVVTGLGKSRMLADAWGGAQLPVALAQPRRTWQWVVDAAAASQLPTLEG